LTPYAPPPPPPKVERPFVAKAGPVIDKGMCEAVLATVRLLESKSVANHAPWDEVLKAAAEVGISVEQAEACLDKLMDEALVYEPTLGKLKVV
jgi:hypothetical protein